MAASLNVQRADCLHYYHCVLCDIPFDFPVAAIAPHVSPQDSSPLVAQLREHGATIVPHQLHVYKEPLSTKFGYLSFFVNLGPTAKTSSEAVHRLMLQWIEKELVPQLLVAKIRVKLAQPPGNHSSEKFLTDFNQSCDILNPSKVHDTRKLETFILSKVNFTPIATTAPECSNAKPTAAGKSAESSADIQESAQNPAGTDDHAQKEELTPVGSATAILDLKPNEALWLKKQHTGMPPLLITNNNANTAHFDKDELARFFTVSLAPLFTL